MPGPSAAICVSAEVSGTRDASEGHQVEGVAREGHAQAQGEQREQGQHRQRAAGGVAERRRGDEKCGTHEVLRKWV
jgi:hypothetical protein